MTKTKMRDKVKELQMRCDCGCKSQVLFQLHPEGILQVDTRDSRRHEWHGVVLYEVEKVRKFLKEEKK